MGRAFGQSLCREEDSAWLDRTTTDISSRLLDGAESSDSNTIFSSISPRVKRTQPMDTQLSLSSMPEVVLFPIKQWRDICESVSHYMTRYREEYGQCCVELNNTYLEYISLLHRAVKHPRYIIHIMAWPRELSFLVIGAMLSLLAPRATLSGAWLNWPYT